MRRYRVVCFSFDSRCYCLTHDVQEHWDEEIRDQHLRSRDQQIAALTREYGEHLAEQKVRNFADLGQNPFSVISYHTIFFEQIRRAFVSLGYYPALTGACALGERILNHMVLKLRSHYRDRPEYKLVYRKESFDDWKVPIDVLASWGVLLTDVVDLFRKLHRLRNETIHFRPQLEQDVRSPALDAIRLIRDIISQQFSAFGQQPWFIPGTPGESYIRKEAEAWPFVREFYLPCCVHVGPHHEVVGISPESGFHITDDDAYGDRDVTDEEFVALRLNRRAT